MKKLSLFLAILLLNLVNYSGYAQSPGSSSPSDSQQSVSIQPADATQTITKNSIADTKMAMRKLWEDHILDKKLYY